MHRAHTDPTEENIRTVVRLEQTALLSRSLAERISERIIERAGSGLSVFLHALFFAGWAAVNTAGERFRFDPFPFNLLTSIVSLEAIILTLFVLANQSRMRREADKREHLDLQINLLAEQEMTLVLRMLEELCQHFKLTHTTSSDAFRALIKHTDLHDLAERLDRNLKSGNGGEDARAADAVAPKDPSGTLGAAAVRPDE